MAKVETKRTPVRGAAARLPARDAADPPLRGEGRGALPRRRAARLPARRDRPGGGRGRRLPGAGGRRRDRLDAPRARRTRSRAARTRTRSWPSCTGRSRAARTATAARCTSTTSSAATWARTPSSAAGCRRSPAPRSRSSSASEPRVAVAFFGDGATNIGTFHESLNLAQLWKVPAVFVCENNHWAESTPARQHLPIEDLTQRAVAFGMHVDQGRRPGRRGGPRRRAAGARARARRQGPGLPASRDLPPRRPLHRRPAGLPREGGAPGAARDAGPDRHAARAARALRRGVRGSSTREVQEIVEASVEFAKAGTDPQARRRAEERLCLSSPTARRSATRSRTAMRRTTTSSSWARTSPRWAARWASRTGMLDEFGPERVRNTPISEMAIVGAGIGAAMQGMRPVVEIMYEDFLTLAMEQIVNQAAKHRYMSGGQLKVPLTIRTQGGAGWSPGAQHAQQLEALVRARPGPEGRLRRRRRRTCAACSGRRSTTTTRSIFFEHRTLYGIKEEVPDELEPIPIGKARVHREGEDVTVVATGRLVHEALAGRRGGREGGRLGRGRRPAHAAAARRGRRSSSRSRRRTAASSRTRRSRAWASAPRSRRSSSTGVRLARRADRARGREVRAAPVRAGDGGVRRARTGRRARGDPPDGRAHGD